VTNKTTHEIAVEADLASAAFRAGVQRKQWRQLSYAFPLLFIAVTAVEPDGSLCEYDFRFELSGFPAVAPEVTIWDPKSKSSLDPGKRPTGSPRVVEAFKRWGNDTVYRPWDRLGGAHNNWSITHPSMTWNPSLHLTFILEDLHGLLTSNSLASVIRAAS
jgi:hypothetical protein